MRGDRGARVDNRVDYDQWQRDRNAAIQALIADFPWLWAIVHHLSNSWPEHIKISQNMADLKTVLQRNSEETRFVMWTFTGQVCEVFNRSIKPAPRSKDNMWAEATMRNTDLLSDIFYLVMVDPLWGEDHPIRRITIFRHPEKIRLNEFVEDVVHLHGSSVRWES